MYSEYTIYLPWFWIFKIWIHLVTVIHKLKAKIQSNSVLILSTSKQTVEQDPQTFFCLALNLWKWKSVILSPLVALFYKKKKMELVISLEAPLKDEESKEFHKQLYRNLKLISRDCGTRGKTVGKTAYIACLCLFNVHPSVFLWPWFIYWKSNKIWKLLFVLRNEIQKYIYSGPHSILSPWGTW